MYKTITLFFCLCLCSLAYAQTYTACTDEFDDPYNYQAPFCELACITCDLNGLFGATDPPQGPQAGFTPPDMCPDELVDTHNPEWIGFVMGADFVRLEIEVFNCWGGPDPFAAGLQFAVYKTGGCQYYTMAANCLHQVFNGEIAELDIFGEPGDLYYLVIDGFNGDVCEYYISVLEGSTEAPPIDEPAAIVAPATICPDQSFNISIQEPVEKADTYYWTVDGIYAGYGEQVLLNSNGYEEGDTIHIAVRPTNHCEEGPTSSLEVIVTDTTLIEEQIAVCHNDFPYTYTYDQYGITEVIPAPGTYTIPIQTLQCPATLELTVTASGSADLTVVNGTICAGDPDNSVFWVGEPGEPGSQVFTSPQTNTLVTLTNVAGCDSLVQVTIVESTPHIENYDYSICSGESIIIAGDTLTEAGFYQFHIDNADPNGCDSLIFVDLTVYSSPDLCFSSCGGVSLDIPSGNWPVDGDTSVANCVTFNFDPLLVGYPVGITAQLTHPYQGDLDIFAVACENTLSIVQRPGTSNCEGGCPCGFSDVINGTFNFADAFNEDPENGLSSNGGNYGVTSADSCGLNSAGIQSFADLWTACPQGPIEVQICVVDHALVDVGTVNNLALLFDTPTVCGCTNPVAINYDPTATIDDGSCAYPCTEVVLSSTIDTINTCADSQVDLLVSATGLTGSGVINWSSDPAEAVNWLSAQDTLSPTLSIPADFSGDISLSVTAVEGACSDMLDLSIVVLPGHQINQDIMICEGETLLWNNLIIDTPGEYTTSLVNQWGCDSIINLNVSFFSLPDGAYVEASICPDAPFVYEGISYDAAGTFFREYSDSLSGCLLVDTIVITTFSVGALVADAGNDTLVCNPSFQLNANLTGNSTGTWLPNDDYQIDDPTDPNSMVFDLNPGTHLFIWEVTAAVCSDSVLRDTMSVLHLTEAAIAVNDTFALNPATALTLGNVRFNDDFDFDSGYWSIVPYTLPGTGFLDLQPDGFMAYFYLNAISTRFKYIVEHEHCPEFQDTATVFLIRSDIAPGNPGNGFSPTAEVDGASVTSIELPAFASGDLVLFNAMGQVVQQQRLQPDTWLTTDYFRRKSLPAGLYHFWIVNEKRDAVRTGSVWLE